MSSESLSQYTSSGDVALFDFRDDYIAAHTVAGLHLESADVATIAATARKLADDRHLLLPDVDALLERCVVALLSGHLVLQGPPGTGKTTLAYVLAEAFNASAHLETATADWSTYDVIGGLHPTSRQGLESLEPWLGHVPRAALECAGVIARHQDEDERKNEPRQAHWLIIDEFSRAEIDKAIGPLYTVLGGGGDDAPLPLWFGEDEKTSAVWLPKRFRIIATMNDVDTNYVYTFSQGLTRRFQFVYVGVPAKDQIEDELQQARISAGEWFKATYGGADFDVAADFVDDPRTMDATTVIAGLLKEIRYDNPDRTRPGWPLGTAQIVDVYRQLALRRTDASHPTSLLNALDLALADRVIPQAGNLLTAQLEAAEAWLGGQALPHTITALQHLRDASATGY
ncbi:MoxR-like ATPase [Rhodococcus opacus M213]|uniref:MoxR-like ATPase n=1 Tax=Rhodococcus opacus M213 TaxID=1129896 RepID=K8XTW9_RHOOP|nr:AAA family ATPase [Rhodococcus opacus]EKT80495.1 MoxR-like ATPase [Rhodococcus opacus M213]